MRFDAIVGYTWQADVLCAGCLERTLDVGEAESALDTWAENEGIDRNDEYSFDSDTFPKVILASHVDGIETCGTCGECLVCGEHWPCSHAYDAILDAARRVGADYGKNAASWTADDILPDAASAQAYVDDPGTVETVGLDLSGEWADGPRSEDVLAEILYAAGEGDAPELDDDFEQEIFDVACDAADDALFAALDERAAFLLAPAPGWNVGDAFSWARMPGVAFRVAGFEAGNIIGVMVGDDAEHVIDPDEATPLERESFCGECGQVGCPHDGYDRGEA